MHHLVQHSGMGTVACCTLALDLCICGAGSPQSLIGWERAVPFGVLPYASGSSIHDAVVAFPRAGGFTDKVQLRATFSCSVARRWARSGIDVGLVVQESLEIIVAGIPRQS